MLYSKVTVFQVHVISRDLGVSVTLGASICRMAASHSTEIADPPDTFKSPVWEHFGFPVEYRMEFLS